MSDAYKTALIRGAITSVLAGVLAFLTSYQQGQALRAALIVGGIQLVYNLIARVGVEGTVDSQAASAPQTAPKAP